MLSSTIKKARIVAYMWFLLIFEATNVFTILECNTCENQSCNFYLLRDWRLSSHRPAVIDIHNLKIENNLFLTAGLFKGLTKASINSFNYPLKVDIGFLYRYNTGYIDRVDRLYSSGDKAG